METVGLTKSRGLTGIERTQSFIYQDYEKLNFIPQIKSCKKVQFPQTLNAT